MQQETMRGSLFPLLPLRVKRQNHEMVAISPISPILVVHVLSSQQDMGHQNRWNRDPLSVFPGWSAKTMKGSLFPLLPLRVKCQNHERVPISPISPKGEEPKPWEGPYFPISPILVAHVLTSWATKIGEIGK